MPYFPLISSLLPNFLLMLSLLLLLNPSQAILLPTLLLLQRQQSCLKHGFITEFLPIQIPLRMLLQTPTCFCFFNFTPFPLSTSRTSRNFSEFVLRQQFPFLKFIQEQHFFILREFPFLVRTCGFSHFLSFECFLELA